MKVQLIDLFADDLSKGSIDIDDKIFNQEVRKDLLSRVVNWQLAKRRSGNHKVKTRGEVHHTTRKPFKQKGTGQARQGMKSVPHMRGGGVAMGPCVRSHAFKLNKKVRVLSLKSALSLKANSNKLFVIDDLAIKDINTAQMVKNLKKHSLSKVLFIDTNSNDSKGVELSIRNLHNIDILPVMGLNVLDILKHDFLILSKPSLQDIAERLNA